MYMTQVIFPLMLAAIALYLLIVAGVRKSALAWWPPSPCSSLALCVSVRALSNGGGPRGSARPAAWTRAAAVAAAGVPSRPEKARPGLPSALPPCEDVDHGGGRHGADHDRRSEAGRRPPGGVAVVPADER